MSIVRTGADVTAGAVGAELDADPDTLVDLIFAICAIPAAVTAAACTPPTIAPNGGGMVCTACMNAPIAPEMVSMVADAIRSPLILLAFFSEFSSSSSYMSAIDPRMDDVALATVYIASTFAFAFSWASLRSSCLNRSCSSK